MLLASVIPCSLYALVMTDTKMRPAGREEQEVGSTDLLHCKAHEARKRLVYEG